jgi:hypothetical protein
MSVPVQCQRHRARKAARRGRSWAGSAATSAVNRRSSVSAPVVRNRRRIGDGDAPGPGLADQGNGGDAEDQRERVGPAHALSAAFH